MKVLVIDSHKSSTSCPAENLHWKNAKIIADALRGDLIWSYPSVNDKIVGGYDKIVFVHASHYAYTDYAWLEASPNADLFYVSNEYNLGEPRTAWMAAKRGRKYTVIANHPAAASKVVLKYVKDWLTVNLNALCYDQQARPARTFEPTGIVYYGSYRKGREPYFKKYLSSGIIDISTHSKNREKFQAIGANGPFIGRLNIASGDLTGYEKSLYIEDTVTHRHYNHLANRFYEALSWGVAPVFDVSCSATVSEAGYDKATFVNSPQDAVSVNVHVPLEWHAWAEKEKSEAIYKIISIIKH